MHVRRPQVQTNNLKYRYFNRNESSCYIYHVHAALFSIRLSKKGACVLRC